MKKAFTLIEIIIVLIIIGILSLVLTQAYITITKLSFTIEQEKNLTEESLMITQILQSISDTATIDYDKYGGKLYETNGFTGTLYLTGGKEGERAGTKIYSSGDCLDLEGEFADITQDPYGILQAHSGCQLILEQTIDGKITTISLLATNTELKTSKVRASKALFKIIPYDSEKSYYGNPQPYAYDYVINELAKPGFWMFIHLYSPFYQPVGTNNVHQPLQLFFNLNAPLPSLFS